MYNKLSDYLQVMVRMLLTFGMLTSFIGEWFNLLILIGLALLVDFDWKRAFLH